MHLFFEIPTWILMVGLLILMFSANEMGYRLGLWFNRDEPEASRTVGNSIKGSIIGLVAFLLGFTFSMTTGRHDVRRKVVLDEANAIGTCYLRAGLLPEPERTKIRVTLRQYVAVRLEFFENGLDPAAVKRNSQEMDFLLNYVWLAVEEVARTDSERLRTSLMVPATNELIDLGSTRTSSATNHVPGPVMWMLLVCIVVTCTLLGHSSGQSGRRHSGLWSAFNILLALILFLVLDFDRPRRGLIQADHTPLIELRQSMDR